LRSRVPNRWTPLHRSRQVTLKNRRAQVLRLGGEAALIIVSVYVAIVLEGASGERAARASALESLRTVQAELERDLNEARAYAQQKRDRSSLFSDLSRWLRSDVTTRPTHSL
jgi:type II secretory pathway component PulM